MSAIKALKNDGTEIMLEEALVTEFKTKLRGEVLTQEHIDYDEVRQVWNGLIDKRPALIARCTGVADVIDSVNFARRNSLLLSVRGGGHNIAGSAVCDGGLMIDLSQMKGIRVDPQNRITNVQGGATWGDLDRETQTFGLAAPGGVVSTTGIAGLTLGGGIGWLRRKYGLSCDSLQSVDMVTANGEFLTVSENEHSDLFWGLRGGGGNFGVATSFEFRLHPVGPVVMFVGVMHPVEKASKVFQAWKNFMAGAPDEVSSQAFVWSVPSVPGFPPEAHGKRICGALAVYVGSADKGEKVLQPLRDIDTPLIDLSGKMPFTMIQSLLDPFFPKRQQLYYFKSLNLDNFDNPTMEVIINRGSTSPSPKNLIAIWHYGGAMSRVGIGDTAFPYRNKPYLLSVDSIWDDPQDSAKVIKWSRDFLEAVRPRTTGGMYVNFAGLGEEGDELVRAAYGPNYERLVELKNKYDPTNLFRVNQNIKPTAG